MAEDVFATIRWAREVGEYVTDRQGRYYDLADDLLTLMATYANGQTGEEVYPAIKTLARRKHKSTRDVRNALDRLEELGLIEETGSKFSRGVELTEWRLCIENEQFEEQAAEAAWQRETERKAAEAARKRKARGSISPNPPVIEVIEAPDAPVRASDSGQKRVLASGTGQKPNFQRGIPKAIPAPEPEVVNPADELMDLVLANMTLTKEENRRAHTVLMKFADRWPRAMEMVRLAIEISPNYEGDLELGCFEEKHDPMFAEPLLKKLEAA